MYYITATIQYRTWMHGREARHVVPKLQLNNRCACMREVRRRSELELRRFKARNTIRSHCNARKGRPPSTSNLNAGHDIRHVEFDFSNRYKAFIGVSMSVTTSPSRVPSSICSASSVYPSACAPGRSRRGRYSSI